MPTESVQLFIQSNNAEDIRKIRVGRPQHNRKTIGIELLVKLMVTQRRARKRFKGLRSADLFPLMAVGDCNGLNAGEFSRIAELWHSSATIKLRLLVTKGYLMRLESKVYVLTDYGREVYEYVKSQLEGEIKGLIDYMAKQAAKKLKS